MHVINTNGFVKANLIDSYYQLFRGYIRGLVK